jgi:HAD superfamily hydrolase (TIGR01509 family)
MGRTVAVFDWDGVVVDSAVAHERSWEALAAEEKLPLPADHFVRGFGKRNELIIPDILQWTRDPAEIRRLSLKKESLYRDIARQGHIRVLPGVFELLRTLRAGGVPCVIGTSTQKENLALAFGLFGLGEWFVGAVSSEDVSRGKPDPEVFLKACALGGGQPAASFVFEDSFSGLQAGLAGGFITIALATTHPREALVPQGAHRIVKDLSEVDAGWLVRGRLD